MFWVNYMYFNQNYQDVFVIITSLKTNCDSFPKRNVIFSRLLTQNEM